MTSAITQLSDLICQSALTLENICADNGWKLPKLDEAFTPESETFRSNIVAAEAANVIAAAALQLAAIVLPPPTFVAQIATGNYKAAALRVCLESNIVEILREAGSEGLHIDAIGAKAKVDSGKIGRLLRYLATDHIFREIKPDVFTNNRVSSVLDSGKTWTELQENPQGKHDGTPGLAATMEHHLDEGAKSAAYAAENLKDATTGFSGEPTQTPFNTAFGHDQTFWTWLERPEQEYRRRRFGSAMRGVTMLQPANAILAAYDWKSLPKNSVVVDVGGGVGASSLPLATTYPHLKIVIQDRAPVIEDAKKLWATELPEAIDSGRVKLQVHDFFSEQSITNAAVFLLKQTIHDWSNPYASKILVQLRKAAAPGTKLLLIDNIMPYACHDPSSEGKDAIPGAVPREAPAPLLPNYGGANAMGYLTDLTMLLLLNSQERTMGDLSKLLNSTGWQPVKVYRTDGASSFLQPVEAVPI